MTTQDVNQDQTATVAPSIADVQPAGASSVPDPTVVAPAMAQDTGPTLADVLARLDGLTSQVTQNGRVGAQLQQQQALFTDGLRRLCMGKVVGADGAAAVVDALDPNDAGNWTPVPFQDAGQ